MRTLVWFRGKDLRIHDHHPLQDAAKSGEVIPVFVLDPWFFSVDRANKIAHRMQFLLQSLEELSQNLSRLGSKLIVLPGQSTTLIPELAQRWKVDRVVAHRWVEPFAKQRDKKIQDQLRIPLILHEGEMLAPPDCILNTGRKPYRVYTPFSRRFRQSITPSAPESTITQLPPLPTDIKYTDTPIPSCRDLQIPFNENLLRGGEAAAHKRLNTFLETQSHRYELGRNDLEPISSSQISADLKFGLLSIRSVWTAISSNLESGAHTNIFLGQLIWREFSHYVLWHWPDVLKHAFAPKFQDFPWREDSEIQSDLQAWRSGHTGYPVVDAASRQLLQTGFMSNRSRMINASFLCKHLLIHYKHGESHFFRTLVDGDWAQNNFGWQWAAGTGCDAQPYFRVFNPTAQGRRFDPDGNFVRRYLPELARLPNSHIHRPWQAPPNLLREAGVRLGTDYPHTIVDHNQARSRYLVIARAHVGRRPSLFE